MFDFLLAVVEHDRQQCKPTDPRKSAESIWHNCCLCRRQKPDGRSCGSTAALLPLATAIDPWWRRVRGGKDSSSGEAVCLHVSPDCGVLRRKQLAAVGTTERDSVCVIALIAAHPLTAHSSIHSQAPRGVVSPVSISPRCAHRSKEDMLSLDGGVHCSCSGPDDEKTKNHPHSIFKKNVRRIFCL